MHPQLSVSERDCSFVGEKTIALKTKNCEESYYYFNGDSANRQAFTDETDVKLGEHVQNGKTDLTVVVRNGKHSFEQTLTYTQVQLTEGGFNLINLNEKYLNGDYELYIWSWSPGRWSKDYEIRDGVVVVVEEEVVEVEEERLILFLQ